MGPYNIKKEPASLLPRHGGQKNDSSSVTNCIRTVRIVSNFFRYPVLLVRSVPRTFCCGKYDTVRRDKSIIVLGTPLHILCVCPRFVVIKSPGDPLEVPIPGGDTHIFLGEISLSPIQATV